VFKGGRAVAEASVPVDLSKRFSQVLTTVNTPEDDGGLGQIVTQVRVRTRTSEGAATPLAPPQCVAVINNTVAVRNTSADAPLGSFLSGLTHGAAINIKVHIINDTRKESLEPFGVPSPRRSGCRHSYVGSCRCGKQHRPARRGRGGKWRKRGHARGRDDKVGSDARRCESRGAMRVLSGHLCLLLVSSAPACCSTRRSRPLPSPELAARDMRSTRSSPDRTSPLHSPSERRARERRTWSTPLVPFSGRSGRAVPGKVPPVSKPASAADADTHRGSGSAGGSGAGGPATRITGAGGQTATLARPPGHPRRAAPRRSRPPLCARRRPRPSSARRATRPGARGSGDGHPRSDAGSRGGARPCCHGQEGAAPAQPAPDVTGVCGRPRAGHPAPTTRHGPASSVRRRSTRCGEHDADSAPIVLGLSSDTLCGRCGEEFS